MWNFCDFHVFFRCRASNFWTSPLPVLLSLAFGIVIFGCGGFAVPSCFHQYESFFTFPACLCYLLLLGPKEKFLFSWKSGIVLMLNYCCELTHQSRPSCLLINIKCVLFQMLVLSKWILLFSFKKKKTCILCFGLLFLNLKTGHLFQQVIFKFLSLLVDPVKKPLIIIVIFKILGIVCRCYIFRIHVSRLFLKNQTLSVSEWDARVSIILCL